MRMKILILIFAVIQQISGQAYHIKFHQSPEENFACTLIEDDFLPKYRGIQDKEDNGFKYSIKPAQALPDGEKSSAGGNIAEVFSRNHEAAQAFMESMCKSVQKVEPLTGVNQEDIEIRKIVDGGDMGNRIDVVFMGDGYTASEKEEFFEDMDRLTEEMFAGATFRSYLPVFNIWAIYVASVESGIGYNGPKDTPFQLYRQSGTLRAILPGDAQHARQICTMTGFSGCDYPSIIGNDDFYGGLGGEFVISTRSHRTGTVVLRHEMGHNFVNVGEEYDNGGVYRGVNSASSVASLGWTAWLSGERKEERAIYRLLEYPWADLNEEGPQTFTFTSDGAYSRWNMVVTVSAAGEEDCLEFTLDGEILPWTTSGFDDREFYEWGGDEGLSPGQHTFSVRTKTNTTNLDIPRMICSIRLHEYGTEDEFHSDINYVSAYPTFSTSGSKTFRPTSEGCLMRNMTYNRFCPICQEGMWAQFLERVSLIDDVTVAETAEPDGTRMVTVNTLKLGQLREPGNEVPNEMLEVRWFRDGVEDVIMEGQFTVWALPGNWEVEVHFDTEEVRNDPRNLLTSTEAFVVPSA